MHGFKSFAQQTELKFDPGVTAVVGPNGCGKSNIVDAVRWVTGEQRARVLRSDKMHSVIFNGTAKRKPLGMSEVMLTIQNTRGVLPTEYSEVTIGRRLYRSGESEYLLNGVQCRLKDILDLFMDTGMGPGAYSVIELKMIDEILSENTQDRRRLFEEAAGITKYKLRRTQALRKLDGTQANLTRIRDLTDEIGKRVESLKRQAEKAARAKELQQRLETLELALAQADLNRLRLKEKKISEEAAAFKNQLEQHTVEQTKEEAEIESLRVDLVGHEQDVSSKQKTLNAHLEEVRSIDTEKRLAMERLESARRNIDRTQNEQREAEVRAEQLKQHRSALESELEEARPLLDKARKVADDAKVESEKISARSKAAWEKLQSLRQEEEAAERDQRERRRQLDRLANRLELIQNDARNAQQQIASFESRIAEARARVKKSTLQLENARSSAANARVVLENAEKEREGVQAKLEKALESLRKIERQHDAVAAEVSLLESLITSYEDLSEAVQYLSENSLWSERPLKTVADVLGCDEKDQPALDAALGSFSTCIVVQSEREARNAIRMLREEDKGQTDILVLDRLKMPTRYAEFIEEAADRGAVPMASIVRVSRPEYNKLAEALLHNCFYVNSLEHGQDLVDTLDELANMLYGVTMPIRYIAESGEWMDARGIMRGGSKRNEDVAHLGRLQRREQYETSIQNLRKLESGLNQKQGVVAQLQTLLKGMFVDDDKQNLTDAERTLGEAERQHIRTSQELESLEQRFEESRDRIVEQQNTVQEVRKEIQQIQAPVESSEETLKVLRNSRVEAEEQFRAAEADNHRALSRFNEASITAVQARNHYENLLRDVERNKEDAATIQTQKATREKHLLSLHQSIKENEENNRVYEQKLDQLYSQRTTLDEAVDLAEQARQSTLSQIQELESKLRSIRQTREQSLKAENSRAVKLVEIQTRIDELIRGIVETYERSLVDEPVTVPENFEKDTSKREVKSLKASLRGMGSINELALESYEEEKDRFEFMKNQQEDLENAEQSLLDTISEINTTAAKAFDETFQVVRTNFARLFSTLFGKDDAADLLLVDPEDPLESPIEIVAKPKGKRPSAITQLSGGEKTLTATALLFAIYLVKPSPFCILDEVDAPLDEANVERFMQLIREFSGETQFIMVTHNRRTMELADRLYGITMQEQGVSKLVGVKFDEATELMAA